MGLEPEAEPDQWSEKAWPNQGLAEGWVDTVQGVR